MKITEAIRHFRKAKGMSQVDLAEKLGITSQFVSKLESRGEKLTLEQLKKIADALEVQLVDLLTFGREKPYNQEQEYINELVDRVDSLEARLADKQELYLHIVRDRNTLYNDVTTIIDTITKACIIAAKELWGSEAEDIYDDLGNDDDYLNLVDYIKHKYKPLFLLICHLKNVKVIDQDISKIIPYFSLKTEQDFKDYALFNIMDRNNNSYKK